MAGPGESKAGFFTAIAVGMVVSVTGVVAGMVKVPTYFANRDVQQAVKTVVHEAEPTMDDARLVNTINLHLAEVKASRYWVEGTRQLSSLDLQLTPQQVTIERDGTRSMAFDIDYSQDVWVPILNRIDHQVFHVHASSLDPR